MHNFIIALFCSKITATNGEENPTAGLEPSGGAETGNSQDGTVTSLVLVRQNARHLFEPRTPETEVTSSCEPSVVGWSLTELIVVQDECAGCLPLAAMLRPHRTENHPATGPVLPQPETGACLMKHFHSPRKRLCGGLVGLRPVHTGDYSRRFRRQFVAENGDCCQKRRLSPNSTTVAGFGDSRRATIVASVDRPLVVTSLGALTKLLYVEPG